MPELPEVQTIVEFLKKKILGETVQDFWSDTPYILKYPPSVAAFKKVLSGKRIVDLKRKGKYVIMDFSGGITLVVHQKMTGHFLLGHWRQERGRWLSTHPGRLKEKVNSYIRFLITFKSGQMLAFSDARKFGAVYLWPSGDLHNLKNLSIGEDALIIKKKFFIDWFASKKGKIKPLLMNQKFLAGIGNIYADEILWESGVHPLRRAQTLNLSEKESIFKAMKKILLKAITRGGSSMSDYRMPDGSEGGYMKIRKVYSLEGSPCSRDGAVIERIKIGQRSSYFCPLHQK